MYIGLQRRIGIKQLLPVAPQLFYSSKNSWNEAKIEPSLQLLHIIWLAMKLHY